MKKLFIILMLTECLFSSNVLAQGCVPWCVTGNTIGTTDYVGGDNMNTNPLELKTLTGAPINFYTNATKYMTILGSTNPGYVGIGSGFVNAKSKLHLNNSGAVDNWFQITTGGSTGGTLAATDGLRIGVIDNTQEVQINQQEAAPMNFLTNGTQRMQIASGDNVGIGDVAQSTGKFYLKNDYSVSSAANGIEITSTNTGGTTNGLKTTATGSGSYPESTSGTASYANSGYHNYGIYSKATGGVLENYGGYLYSLGNTNTTLSVGASCIAENGVTFNYGAFTSALNGQEAYGIWSQADGGSNLNYEFMLL